MRHSRMDLNTLLKCANLGVAGLIGYAWTQLDGASFVDGDTMWLGLALCAQTHMALSLEARRRDPFVLLLVFWTLVYYELRIYTLATFDISAVFGRFAYDADDSNFALGYMIVANFFLYAGFFLARRDTESAVAAEDWRAAAPQRVVIVLLISLALTYLSGSYWSEGGVPRGLNFLVLYFSPPVIILMALAYFAMFRRTLNRLFVLAIGGMILFEIVAHTLLGSRGALVAFVQSCLIVLLALRGRVQFSRRSVWLGVAAAPLLLALMVVAFVASSYIRTARNVEGANLGVGLEMAQRFGESDIDSRPVDLVLGLVASRVGFFDFSAEVIAHEREYSSVVNWQSYGRSIVDNLLTPGVDFYDQPKIANSLMFVYRDLGTPSKKLASDDYQSDQLGIHGEFYILFGGWASLPVYFVVAFLLRRLYDGVRGRTPFVRALGRAIVLLAFTRLIESFGLDWLITEMLPFVAAVFVYGFFFPTRRIRAPVAATSQALA